MPNKTETLEPDYTYHIYNRANGSERLFLNDGNYRFFLDKYRHYIDQVAGTFCYCLMPNHFHFLIRVRSQEELREAFPKFETLEKLISKQFSNLFSSYTQALNKVTGRKGSLFMKNFKRKKVTDEKYFKKLIHYIHYNPIEAGLSDNISAWKYSSYKTITGSKPTDLLRDEVLDYFGDRTNFIYCHQNPPEVTGIEEF